MDSLIELSRTSDSIYYCMELPLDAYDFNMMRDRIYNTCSGYNFELLGALDSLTEDQAREMVTYFMSPFKGFQHYNDPEFKVFILPTAKESLQSLIESKGVNTSEKVIPIIKVKL